MATIPMESFQRLTLFYLIGQFPRGVFSSFRLQRVLYFATRDVEPKPFTFHHREGGPYSVDMANQLLLMLESDFLKRESLDGEFSLPLWQIGDALDGAALDSVFEAGLPRLARAIAAGVRECGFLQPQELGKRARAELLRRETSPGCELLRACSRERVQIALDGEENEELIEDLEMYLVTYFGSLMNVIPELEKAHGVLPGEWAPV